MMVEKPPDTEEEDDEDEDSGEMSVEEEVCYKMTDLEKAVCSVKRRGKI